MFLCCPCVSSFFWTRHKYGFVLIFIFIPQVCFVHTWPYLLDWLILCWRFVLFFVVWGSFWSHTIDFVGSPGMIYGLSCRYFSKRDWVCNSDDVLDGFIWFIECCGYDSFSQDFSIYSFIGIFCVGYRGLRFGCFRCGSWGWCSRWICKGFSCLSLFLFVRILE